MSAGVTVRAKCSFSRGGTSPAPLGRVLAIGASGAPLSPRRGCGCGRAGPLPAGAFGAELPPGLAMSLTLVDRLAAPLAGANLAAVAEHFDPRPGRLVAAAADRQHVGQRQRPLTFDDAALPQLLGRPLVLLDHVDVLDDDPPLVGQHV